MVISLWPQYGLKAILWPFGHMTIWLYDIKRTQDGYLLKPHYTYSNQVKELIWFVLSVKNESKKKIWANYPMHNQQNHCICKMFRLMPYFESSLELRSFLFKNRSIMFELLQNPKEELNDMLSYIIKFVQKYYYFSLSS